VSEEPRGVVGVVSQVSRSLIGALPPAFIMLVLINAAFIGMVLWFLDNQLDQRMKTFNRILDACLASGVKP
jgi:hypothetical protein